MNRQVCDEIVSHSVHNLLWPGPEFSTLPERDCTVLQAEFRLTLGVNLLLCELQSITTLDALQQLVWSTYETRPQAL